MHFHICPQEIAVILMVFEQVQLYVYHYSHIIHTWLLRAPKPDDCEICEQEE